MVGSVLLELGVLLWGSTLALSSLHMRSVKLENLVCNYLTTDSIVAFKYLIWEVITSWSDDSKQDSICLRLSSSWELILRSSITLDCSSILQCGHKWGESSAL